MAKILLAAQIKDAHGCPHDTKLFEELFGEGDEATEERAVQFGDQFDAYDAARRLLTSRQQAHFKALVRAAFRGLDRSVDPKKVKRRKALALAFVKAYNGTEE